MELKQHLRNGLRWFSDLESNAPFMETMTNLFACERGAKALPTVTEPAAISALSVSHPHPRLHHEEAVHILADGVNLYTFDSSALTKSAITTYSAQNPGSTLALNGSGPYQFAAFGDTTWFITNGSSLAFKLASNTSNKVCVTRSDSTPSLQIDAICNFYGRLVIGGASGNAVSVGSSTDFSNFYSAWLHSEAKKVVTTEDDAFGSDWLIYSPEGGGDNEIPFTSTMALLGAPGINNSTLYADKFAEMTLGWVESGQMGMFPCRNTGAIKVVKPYQGDLIVYGARGVSRLSMTERGFVETPILDTGVAGRGAVAGDDKEHCFVSKHGELYILGERGATYEWAKPLGGALYRLGYSEYVGALTLNDNLIVTCDPVERYYWVSSSVTTYVLSRTGLSKSAAVQVLSALRVQGSTTLIGTGTLASDPQPVTLKTHKFDGDKKEIWEVQFVDVAGIDTATDSADRWKVTMDARLYKQTAMQTFSAVTTDGRGSARTSLSGSEFKVGLSATDRTKVDLDNAYIREGKGKPSMSKWL